MNLKNLLKNPKTIITLILVVALATRLFRIWEPNTYVFDEVYHGFTAKEYLLGHKEAWVWWTTPPAGVAYEWTHPPLAKEIMAASLGLFQTMDPWGWRIPGILMNLLSIYLVYRLGLLLFKNHNVGLIAAFAFSIDGLNFVQSRTGMNDSYVVAFILASLFFTLSKKFLFGAILFGLALSSKWSAIYLLPITVFILIYYKAHLQVLYYLFIPFGLYLFSYTPFFMHNLNRDQFIELQKQMWWYHTNLKATHEYSSPWWSWPLNLYPVWYNVQYLPATKLPDGTEVPGGIGNIFASGNLVVFLIGLISIIYSGLELPSRFLKKIVEHSEQLEQAVQNYLTITTEKIHIHHSFAILITILGYASFLLPWAISPRIMFLYHYSPCVPFLCLALGYQLNKFHQQSESKFQFWILLGLMAINFLFLYPMITGIPLDRGLMQLFFLTNLTKNPFI